jgi:DNA-binding Lrp family transcriptional regulator
MDTIDVALIQLLLANSRRSYGELAEQLGLSVNAVHKRIQALIEAGIIRKFTAKVSTLAANGINVFISGTSQLATMQNLPDKMRTQGSIYWLAIGGAKYLYVGAYLKDITELEPIVSYVKKEAKIAEPTIGIMDIPAVPFISNPKSIDRKLCDLDYRIIHSLRDNARKAISEVAEETGVSAKTVRRRLNRMIKNWLIELSLEWYPDHSNDIITLVDVHFKPDTDMSLAYQILKKYAPNMLFYWSFANLPGTATYTIWTTTMKELQILRENLENETNVITVVPNILYVGYVFSTWRDKLTEKQ